MGFSGNPLVLSVWLPETLTHSHSAALGKMRTGTKFRKSGEIRASPRFAGCSILIKELRAGLCSRSNAPAHFGFSGNPLVLSIGMDMGR